MHRPQATHLLESNVTSIDSLSIASASTLQTAVQPPQWTHFISSRFILSASVSTITFSLSRYSILV